MDSPDSIYDLYAFGWFQKVNGDGISIPVLWRSMECLGSNCADITSPNNHQIKQNRKDTSKKLAQRISRHDILKRGVRCGLQLAV